ncbi:hypothetical protein QQ045_013317 [Rhodiola kirilowii]
MIDAPTRIDSPTQAELHKQPRRMMDSNGGRCSSVVGLLFDCFPGRVPMSFLAFALVRMVVFRSSFRLLCCGAVAELVLLQFGGEVALGFGRRLLCLRALGRLILGLCNLGAALVRGRSAVKFSGRSHARRGILDENVRSEMLDENVRE